ncbi:mercury(II) reductase [Desulfoferrobacter suflitae]|uniref:mercury(II) reductase n=1 Tax=Desulfoferrobacter suflitae TaxID=2865782 RepID=UPI002163FFBA|nr:mercury(II) reductase [Desulfoferrobacter suflitae]MCK8604202.1 mercury(II) reductase [Desulfoferrobacter suflitae]MDD3815873.1 mercury(II) reductase [Desulfocapsaceae bacterium]
MNRFDCDLLILGAGSTAFAAALRAQELGKTAIMVEQRTIGGTCANRGCLPSKNLIGAAAVMHEMRHSRYPGLNPLGMDFDFKELIGQKDQLVQEYRKKKYQSLVGDKIRTETGHAEFIDAHTVQVKDKLLSGRKILIATGARSFIPPIEGIEQAPFLTSDLLGSGESMELTEFPDSLLIIGGGYIALELGQMFQRFGTAVTILERSSQLLVSGYEPEVGKAIARILTDESIRIVTNATAMQVEKTATGVTVVASIAGDEERFSAERLLIATGRRPNTDRIGIDRAGVLLDEHGAVKVNERLQTNIANIFAAGDVIGREAGSQMATPVGSQDGGIAAHNALAGKELKSVDHRVIPRVIFTDPQIAMAGMTEEQAEAAGHRCWCNTLPMALVPHARALRDSRGIIKMVADAESNEVLGVSMVGRNAGEVIHEAAMGIRFHAKLDDFIDLLHVFPTMAEALKIVAISRFKNPERLSCCAQ